MTVRKHSEAAFETEIVASLVAEGGLIEGDPSTFDIEKALFVDDVLAFLHVTQQPTLDKLRPKVSGDLDAELVKWLVKALAQKGSLNVLRHGFKFYGKPLKVAQFQPAFGLNPEVSARYDANIVKVTRQVHFDPKRPMDSLDLVLSINGIPVVTAELKNPMTGQSVEHAKRQYMYDREPGAPIFDFMKRALVHFAVDPNEAWMTTRLAKGGTYFLPFNKGHDKGAGNPPAGEKHRTHYLWEDIWQRDTLLELVQRYIHLEVEWQTDPRTGRQVPKEKMIFPRFHQHRVVRRLIHASRTNGPGTNYLIQHSAGSGKSNSIAWLAHQLQSLHNEQDKPVFNGVVVLTDRKVLDRQLQAKISAFDHVEGVVKRIDKNSKQLAKALEGGSPIIISTIHKFSFIADKIAALPDRNYAIIVDEAHSSQSGEMADAVKEMLSGSDLEEQLQHELDEQEDPSTADQLALRAALLRGPRPNISYFAFTATPKFKTLKLFGHTDANGEPVAFDLYSMRQAIEEGFILDVLKNYQTWNSYFSLIKKVEEDPELPVRKASAALARFVSLHPHNLSQKTEIIIEHFRKHVAPELGGKAKAMVVTSSRLHATRYKRAFDAYLKEKNITDVACLVAFSGEVKDPDEPKAVTEQSMNPPKTGDIAEAFDTDGFNVLIVANKYQTGFDQPKLVAMYVDKKLAGVQAVQTLSRLNRTTRGKERTFVLDFVNEREHILKCFQDYYEATTIDEDVDPQRLYELSNKLRQSGVFLEPEVNTFARVFYDPKRTATDHARLNTALDPARDRFLALDEDRQDDFRTTANAYVNLYSFLGRIISFQDADLEKLYVYLRLLLRVLRESRTDVTKIQLDDAVELASYELKMAADGDIALSTNSDATVSGPTSTGTGKVEEIKSPLSELLEKFNARFGSEFTEEDMLVVEALEGDMARSDGLAAAAAANTEDTFRVAISDASSDALLERYERNAAFVDRVMGNEEMMALLNEHLTRVLYRRLRGEV